MPLQFQRLEIPDVILIKIDVIKDERGFFMETYKKSEFINFGISEDFVQDNHSFSAKGTLRGLHYQKHPHAQGKLIRALKGEIFDVAVDIRKGSPTYSKWVGEILTADNARMLYIPPGFAHGFCVLSEKADILYKVTDEYAPDCDRGIFWNDPEINIKWGIAEPILSPRDTKLPLLKDVDNNFNF